MFTENPSKSINALIYGAGAVGLGIASCLLKAGMQTALLARLQTVEALKKYGLLRTGIFGQVCIPPSDFTVAVTLDNIPEDSQDFILVCTKSCDSQSAADELARHQKILCKNGKIILFQNGWGNADVFIRQFPKERIYSARVITGFIRTKPNQVEITVHADAVHIGSLFGQPITAVSPLCEKITQGGIPCRTETAIEKDLWAKMLYNCALSPRGRPRRSLWKAGRIRIHKNHHEPTDQRKLSHDAGGRIFHTLGSARRIHAGLLR